MLERVSVASSSAATRGMAFLLEVAAGASLWGMALHQRHHQIGQILRKRVRVVGGVRQEDFRDAFNLVAFAAASAH
jgi:hypothetical protein